MEFKPGDRIKYVRKSVLNEELGWEYKAGCVLGKVYTVKSRPSASGNIKLKEDPFGFYLSPECFILDDTKEKLDIILERKNE